jgi:hypothetical protein
VVEPGSGGLRRNNRRDDAAIAANIEQRHGELTPAIVVEEARDVSHPWHTEFEWNDGVAGERYRLNQARRLIAQVRITVIQGRSQVAQVAYVHDPGLKHQQGYIPLAIARASDDKARTIVVAELHRVQWALRRCLSIAGALGLAPQVEKILTEVDQLLDLTSDDLDEALAA